MTIKANYQDPYLPFWWWRPLVAVVTNTATKEIVRRSSVGRVKHRTGLLSMISVNPEVNTEFFLTYRCKVTPRT